MIEGQHGDSGRVVIPIENKRKSLRCVGKAAYKPVEPDQKHTHEGLKQISY